MSGETRTVLGAECPTHGEVLQFVSGNERPSTWPQVLMRRRLPDVPLLPHPPTRQPHCPICREPVRIMFARQRLRLVEASEVSG